MSNFMISSMGTRKTILQHLVVDFARDDY